MHKILCWTQGRGITKRWSVRRDSCLQGAQNLGSGGTLRVGIIHDPHWKAQENARRIRGKVLWGLESTKPPRCREGWKRLQVEVASDTDRVRDLGDTHPVERKKQQTHWGWNAKSRWGEHRAESLLCRNKETWLEVKLSVVDLGNWAQPAFGWQGGVLWRLWSGNGTLKVVFSSQTSWSRWRQHPLHEDDVRKDGDRNGVRKTDWVYNQMDRMCSHFWCNE